MLPLPQALPSPEGTAIESPAQRGSVVERAEACLRGNAYLALKNVGCEFDQGVLTLRGCLPTYHLKQMAQTAVAHIEGVERIVNAIEVVSPSARISRPI